MKRAAIVLLVLLSGCSFFGKSKQSRFYSLDRVAGTPAASVRGVPIAIESLELPPGFDRREVIVRKANHELEIRNGDQWSEMLEPMVLHTLAFDLASRLPEGMIVLPGETKPATGRALDVVVEEFAAGPESRVVLSARWILHTAGSPDFSKREEIAVDIPALDSANVAAGMSQAIGSLADRIVQQLSGR
jgi:uncharacterized lipoprotein YmbA